MSVLDEVKLIYCIHIYDINSKYKEKEIKTYSYHNHPDFDLLFLEEPSIAEKVIQNTTCLMRNNTSLISVACKRGIYLPKEEEEEEEE